MFDWIYERPDWEVGSLFALVFLLLTWGATLALRRHVHRWFHTEGRANDMVGFVLSSFSVLYGLLVGLVAAAAYQNITTVAGTVSREASTLGALYRGLTGYPPPARDRLRDKLRDYTRLEIERDWPQMQRGIVPLDGTHRLGEFSDDLMRFTPKDAREDALHSETLRQLDSVVSLRTLRLDSVSTGIPALLWWVVGIGAVITLLLVAMLAMEIHVHLILGAALAGFLGLVVFLTAVMDHPFRGKAGVDGGPFKSVYRGLMLPNDAVNRSMTALIARASALGAPRIEGVIPVAGRPVPALYFGAHAVNNSTGLVDEITREQGGVASLFVKSGESYVRVATSTRAPDGSRATGTLLDPQGPAIQMIRRGEAYYGDAQAVGKAYVTGYEPMTDAAGEVIGIYCTAFLKP